MEGTNRLTVQKRIPAALTSGDSCFSNGYRVKAFRKAWRLCHGDSNPGDILPTRKVLQCCHQHSRNIAPTVKHHENHAHIMQTWRPWQPLMIWFRDTCCDDSDMRASPPLYSTPTRSSTGLNGSHMRRSTASLERVEIWWKNVAYQTSGYKVWGNENAGAVSGRETIYDPPSSDNRRVTRRWFSWRRIEMPPRRISSRRKTERCP
jgi:hypothetical protein